MASSGAVNLEDIPSVDLMTEALRRMKCDAKPDKRLILVGNNWISLSSECICMYIHILMLTFAFKFWFFISKLTKLYSDYCFKIDFY